MSDKSVAELLAEETGRPKEVFEPPQDAEYPTLEDLVGVAIDS